MAESSLELRLQRLESQRETEKAAVLDLYGRLDRLKERIDGHYGRIRALEGDPIPEPQRIDDEEDEPQSLHTVALQMVDSLGRSFHLLPEIRDTLKRAIREPMEQSSSAVTESLTDQPAPAGSLVELLENEGYGRTHARAAIRVVAGWLKQGRLLHAAELLEHEADREPRQAPASRSRVMP